MVKQNQILTEVKSKEIDYLQWALADMLNKHLTKDQILAYNDEKRQIIKDEMSKPENEKSKTIIINADNLLQAGFKALLGWNR